MIHGPMWVGLSVHMYIYLYMMVVCGKESLLVCGGHRILTVDNIAT